MDSGTTTISESRNITCEPEQNFYTLAFQPFVLPSFMFNILVFTAAVFDRKKLTKRNYLFASVISTLLGNILYMATLEWILLDNYFEEPVMESLAGTISFAKYVWALEESITVAVPFLICGNVVCLSYVTVKSASYVGRVANIEDNEKSKRRSIKVRRITRVLLATSWAVPAILTILGTTTMNCVVECICPSTNFKGNLCPNQTHCSAFWAPVTKSYIWMNVGLWSCAIFGLFVLVGYSIAKYQKTTKPSSRDRPITDQAPMDGSTNNDNSMTSQTKPQKQSRRRRKWSKRSLKHRLNSRLRFAVIVTALYAGCSACFMAAIALDTVHPETNDMLIFALSRVTMYLYTTLSPIVMVWHLPVLKVSLGKLHHKIRQSCR